MSVSTLSCWNLPRNTQSQVQNLPLHLQNKWEAFPTAHCWRASLHRAHLLQQLNTTMGSGYKNPKLWRCSSTNPTGAGLTSSSPRALSPQLMAGAAAPVPGEFLWFRQAAKSNPPPQVPAPGCCLMSASTALDLKIHFDFAENHCPQCSTHTEVCQHRARGAAERLLPTSAATKHFWEFLSHLLQLQ